MTTYRHNNPTSHQIKPATYSSSGLALLSRLFPICLSRQTGADSAGYRHTHLPPPDPAAMLHLMKTQAIAFDTHNFVKRLTKAGMPEDQAEVLANGQSDLYERLVTKEYFEFTLSHELEKLRAELKHDIETLRAELKHDIEKVRAELKLDIEKLRADLEQKFNQQEAAIREMEQKLAIRLGAFLGISVTVLALIIKFV